MSYAGGVTETDVYTYPATSNRLDQIVFGSGGGRTLTYDAAGNVTFDNRNGPGYGYSYDAAGRMSAFAINGVIQAEYEYNVLGQQVVRRLTQAGQTIHSLHDRDGNRIAEYLYDESLGTSSLIREYIWANGGVVGVYENGTLYFVRTDHIMRPVFATDVSGAVAWEASYLPFGGMEASSGPNPTLRFPGQWFQSETGLHQNWMRDYDPTTGRYMQADPLGLVDGASVYGYALQNPGRYTDPRGEYTYRDAQDSLMNNGTTPDHGFSAGTPMYSDEQLFNEWLRLEQNDRAWIDDLQEPCPCNINDRDSSWTPPRPVSQRYHPGGVQEIRKYGRNGSRAGRQCVYDENGRLMTNAPAAGTADRRLPDTSRPLSTLLPHYRHDVVPYDSAKRLRRESDYFDVRPLMVGSCCQD